MKSSGVHFPFHWEFIAAVLVFLLLAVMQATSDWQKLRSAAAPLVAPITALTLQRVQAIVNPLLPISDWFVIQDRVTLLATQLAEANGKLAQAEVLRKENAELRALLENRHLAARTRRIARPIVSVALPTVWIGEQSGVEDGWLVTYRDTLLGRIIEVDGQYAQVELLTNQAYGGALVETTTGVKGVTRSNNGRVYVTQLAADALLAPGEKIVTSGQPGIPPGRFVGIIAEVIHDPTAATQTVVVDQLVSFYQTPVVEIEE